MISFLPGGSILIDGDTTAIGLMPASSHPGGKSGPAADDLANSAYSKIILQNISMQIPLNVLFSFMKKGIL